MFEYECVSKAVKVYCANPYWRTYYEGAPSEACRERIALSFFYGIYNSAVTPEEYVPERERLERKLKLEDWVYLERFAGNNPWRGLCRKKIRELGGAI